MERYHEPTDYVVPRIEDLGTVESLTAGSPSISLPDMPLGYFPYP